MTIREIIEARAREAAEKIEQAIQTQKWQSGYRAFTGGGTVVSPDFGRIVEDVCIAILTDPQIGFKEALETLKRHKSGNGCADCYEGHHPSLVCTCPCHTAEAKLAEIQELEGK